MTLDLFTVSECRSSERGDIYAASKTLPLKMIGFQGGMRKYTRASKAELWKPQRGQRLSSAATTASVPGELCGFHFDIPLFSANT